MNFSEVVTEVMSIVKRPDKLAEVRSAVNSTLQYCCTTEDFARDLVEEAKAIDATQYAQSLSLSVLTRFRKFRYMKPSNRNVYITPMAPDKIFVRKSTPLGRKSDVELLDKYYIAGNSVVFKMCSLAPTLIVGYYQYPPLLANLDTHWVLDVIPTVVVDGAAAKMFRLLGDDKSATSYSGEFMRGYAMATKDLKSGVANG